MFKKNILFVCTGNSCRSVMASYYLKKLMFARDDIEVNSAGISAIDNLPASENTVEVLKKEGINASGHRAKTVTAEMIKNADFIFVMNGMHKEEIINIVPDAWDKVYLLGSFGKPLLINLNIPDPIGKTLEFYAATLDMIKEAVRKIVKIIIDESEDYTV